MSGPSQIALRTCCRPSTKAGFEFLGESNFVPAQRSLLSQGMGFICQRLDICVARMLQGRRAGSQQKHRGNTLTLDEDFRFRRDTLPADHPTETCEKIHLAARQKITHPITHEQRAPGLVLEKLANDPGLAVALSQNLSLIHI